MVAISQPRILVIGRGRSGTGYCAGVLQKMGLDVGHERDRSHGSSAHCWAYPLTESIYTSAGWEFPPRPPLDSYTHVWHAVREPLANIASLGATTMELQQHTMPEILEQYAAKRLALLTATYYYWNQQCEHTLVEAMHNGSDAWRFRVEDEGWPVTAARVLTEWSGHHYEPPLSMPRNVNTRRNDSRHLGQLTWAEIEEAVDEDLLGKLHAMVLRYGYSIHDAPKT